MIRLQLLLTVLALVIFPASGDQQRPNLLGISADDLNDWIEPLGGHPH